MTNVPVSDSDIHLFNFALHTEWFSLSFYNSGLARFSVKDFVNDGLSPWVYGRFQQIQDHESVHVRYLYEQVKKQGGEAAKACHYDFPHDTPTAFVEFASWLEAIGAAAYHGVTVLLDDQQFASASGSIFAIEEQHSGWIDSAVMKKEPWSGPFQVPLNPRQIMTLISPYVLSCPPGNPPLPVLYPSLRISTCVDSIESCFDNPLAINVKPGQSIQLLFKLPGKDSIPSGAEEVAIKELYAAFLTSNAGVLYVSINLASSTSLSSADSDPQSESKREDDFKILTSVSVPSELLGDAFVLITKSNSETEGLKEENMIAGLALVRVVYDSGTREMK
ncbi:hypothetical protein D9757_010167 [Collybiopsis confluens]|uniref:Uncharacterized protein n=1 Tax=Collybiopsis confluens TaxID=2823264 RepID=A0A8H5LYZ7_9AGAR|nr:hypothetical protein D9757_010167 [Collybiopsis confluens]